MSNNVNRPGVRVAMRHPRAARIQGWMLGETEYAPGGGVRVAWDRPEPIKYTKLPHPGVVPISRVPKNAKVTAQETLIMGMNVDPYGEYHHWSHRDRSRRSRRDEAAPAAAPLPAPVAGDRARTRRCEGSVYKNGRTAKCGLPAIGVLTDNDPKYKDSWPVCIEHSRVSGYGPTYRFRRYSKPSRSRRDWPGDRAGHRRAARKGWARKRRVSRAAKTLARSRKGTKR